MAAWCSAEGRRNSRRAAGTEDAVRRSRDKAEVGTGEKQPVRGQLEERSPEGVKDSKPQYLEYTELIYIHVKQIWM